MLSPKNAPKSLLKVLADERVESFENETDTGDGYWIYLRPGWNWEGVHVVHEWNVANALHEFKRITKCEPGCPCGWDKEKA